MELTLNSCQQPSSLMKQYMSIKEKSNAEIVLFRVENTYECFGPDAEKISQILGTSLTYLHHDNGTALALSGFDFCDLEASLFELVRAGKRVAICETSSN